MAGGRPHGARSLADGGAGSRGGHGNAGRGMIVLISLVVAVAENGVIGADAGLPWRLKGDMRHFRAVTMHKPVIMGRKTFDSIGKPLAGRTNIVLTRDADWAARLADGGAVNGTVANGAVVVHSLEEAFDAARETDAEEACVIGGGQIYLQALPHADRIHLTRVHMEAEGDTYFPPLDPAQWRQVSREEHAAGPEDTAPYTIIQLDRLGA